MTDVRRKQAIEEASAYCDLSERLPLIPPSASIRGMYFRSLEAVLGTHGLSERYHAIFPERFSALRFYPISEFLVRLVVGGALLHGPARVHEGLFEIGRHNAVAFSDSLIGKVTLRLLSRDPRKLLAQGVAAKRQSYNVGRWTLSFPEPHVAQVNLWEEYLYLESYLLGAAVGTFDSAGISVAAEASLTDRFNGVHLLRWGPALVEKSS